MKDESSLSIRTSNHAKTYQSNVLELTVLSTEINHLYYMICQVTQPAAAERNFIPKTIQIALCGDYQASSCLFKTLKAGSFVIG